MRTRSRAAAAASLVAVLAVVWAPAASFSGWTARAASPTTIELTSDGTGVAGSVVTITVVLYDASGAVFDGKGTSTRVRFYFSEGSPNDLSARNGADMVCSTGTVGWCQVSYLAAVGGTDSVCAVVAGPAARCMEPKATSSPVGHVDVDIEEPEPEPDPQPTQAPVQASNPPPGSTSSVGHTPSPSIAATPPPTSEPRPAASPRPSPSAAPVSSPTPRPTSDSEAPDGAVVGAAGPTGGDSPSDGTVPPPNPGIAREAADEPQAGVGALVEDIAARVGSAIKPAAVAAVASTFTFPLSLMAVVLLFLLVQARLDGRDPKLRTTSADPGDTTIAFVEESDL